MEVKELNEKYQRASELHDEAFKLLKEYVHGMLELHGGSIGFEVKSDDDCEEDGEEYYDQFPVIIDIDGRNDSFPLAVTKVYLNGNGSLRVDGEEQSEWGNEWHKGLYTRENYSVYHDLAYFINEVIERTKVMEERKVKAFFNDQVDTHRKVICVFGENVSEEQIKEVVSEYLREHEYDDVDDLAPLHTAEEIEETANNIINGGVFDCDMDRYFMDEVVMYV